MDIILPDREAARRNGWRFQVQWVEEGNTCFMRCHSGAEADARAQRLREQGLSPTVADLHDLLQLY